MGKEELFEEIRTLVNEPQDELVTKWVYSDDDLILQVRSALRRLRAVGITTDVQMSPVGVFSGELTSNVGMLIAYFVAYRLLSGDLINKLKEGELGLMWRSGTDVIDTKVLAGQFKTVAEEYKEEFNTLLSMFIIGEVDESLSALGTQDVP